MYSNDVERANRAIYDDYKLRPLVPMIYTKILQRCEGSPLQRGN